MGTAFVCAEESVAHPAFKQAFVRASARDAVPSVQVDPAFRVIPVRAIANAGTRRFAEIQVEVIGRFRRGEISQEEASLAIERYWAGALRRAVVEGDVEHGSLMAGQSVGLVKAVRPAAEILAELVGQAEATLARLEGGGSGGAVPPGRRRGRVAAMPAGGGRVAPEPPTEMRPELSGSRRLLRRLVDVVAEPVAPQQRLDRIVSIVAANLVAEVCSVYFHRAGDVLELFATEGLAKEAVHLTRMRVGEGLVGTIAAQGASSTPPTPATTRASATSRDRRGGLPLVPGRPDPARGPGRGRAHGPEPGAQALRRGGGRGDAGHRHGPRRDVRHGRAGRRGRVRGRGRGRPRGAAAGGDAARRGRGRGRAWPHEPRVEVTRLLADDPQAELARLERAVAGLLRQVDEMLSRPELVSGEQREILEAYRMFAHDAGWLRRIREAIGTGLAAEAAVRRVQEETRVRIGHASDPYLRERLTDLEDLAERLLRHLVGRAATHDPAALPGDDVILVARNLSAADLLEYDRKRLRGIVLEEGSKTAHVTIVARAFDIPMLGRIEGAMDHVAEGDLLALDGDNGQLFVRPGDEVQQAFQTALTARNERRRMFEALRDLPSVTRDGVRVSLGINAAFLIDLAELDATGAEGCGLYRTELTLMTRASYPTAPRWPSTTARCSTSPAGGRSCSARSTSAATRSCPTGGCRPRRTRPWAGGRSG
jgi:phosphohistidine swiveling domain-containing protein